MNNLLNGEKDRVNVYAVVLDCSSPYFKEEINKYVSLVTLIDETLHPDDPKKASKKVVKATLFGKTEAEMPHVKKIGSILRLHRGETKKFGNAFQFNCDFNIKGSWVLYASEGQDIQEQHGRNITRTSRDDELLKAIQSFSNKYLCSTELAYTPLCEAIKEKKTDFDTLVYIAELKLKGVSVRAKFLDESNYISLNLHQNYRFAFSVGQIVRIRSANIKNPKEITLNEYSNILIVSEKCKSATLLKERLVDENAPIQKIKDMKKFISEYIQVPITKPLRHCNEDFATLNSIYMMSPGTESGKKKFRIKVAVMRIDPKDPKEWIVSSAQRAKPM